MKKVIYSPHLTFRLKFRGIPDELPKTIYLTSKERYFDKDTFKKVAVKRVKSKARVREMAVIYGEVNGQANLITIHPLKKYQKYNRVKSGRWVKL